MRVFTDQQLQVFEKSQIECADIIALLGELEDDELPAALLERLKTHINGCPSCQLECESYHRVVILAHSLATSELTDDVSRRLRQKLNERLGLKLPLK